MSGGYHFIGIGGIGMSGLARLLLSQKIAVTGSDLALNPTVENLIKEGAIVHKGHAAENVPLKSHVVYTSDVNEDNPEYQAALKLQLPLLHRSDLLAALLKGHKALAVAGTHGKTSTTALLASVLVEGGFDPSFTVGGILPAFQSNARLGKGDFFPFEADESDRSFLKYHPYGAIVTNIDNDHLNNYEDSFSLLVDSFRTFIGQVLSPKHLFWCKDDPHLSHLNISGQSYGFSPTSDWKILTYRQEDFKMFFDLEHEGHLYSQIELALVGRHNVANASAVFALAITLGVAEEKIRNALKTFQGVLRRCEQKGGINNIKFLDDYAHHPVEIQTTLQGIRQAIGPSRLIAVFQPHRYSRTKDCLGQYGSIFNEVDQVIVTDIYGAGETPIPQISHALIIQEIERESTVSCQYVLRSALNHYLSEYVRPYDVVVSLGAGDITKLGSETLSLLEKKAVKPIQIGVICECDGFDEIGEKLHHLSPPSMNYFPFYLSKQGHWAGFKSMPEVRSSSPDNIQDKEKLSAAVLKQLQGCDLVIPALNVNNGFLQGFLEILEIPYFGSSPKETWLSQEVDLVRQMLNEKGIRALSPHLTLAGGTVKGEFYEFFARGGQDIPILAFSKHTLAKGALTSDERLSEALHSQAVELSKRIFRALGCTRAIVIRLLLDNQKNGFWFDRILPVNGKELLTFFQNNNDEAKKMWLDLILFALRKVGERQKRRPHV